MTIEDLKDLIMDGNDVIVEDLNHDCKVLFQGTIDELEDDELLELEVCNINSEGDTIAINVEIED